MTNAAPAPLPCASCEGHPIDHDADVRCEDCRRTPGHATCEDCGDAPATFRSRDGHVWCTVCAAEIALQAEKLLQAIRATVARQPRLARTLLDEAKLKLVANDIEVAS